MYSGTTFRKSSGGFIGVHQRIDRLAYRNLSYRARLDTSFPTLREILHFEGNNGPDGIKRKSPSQDEPWHFIDPADSRDTELVTMINDHMVNLSLALRATDMTRAAFEAAWLAHAITDGMTPAHHYPLANKIEELWGKPKDERLSISDKNIIRGHTRRETVRKNWEYWGAKGVFSTHVLFELGVATAIKTTRYKRPILTDQDIVELSQLGFEKLFMVEVKRIYALGMYEEFWKKGWSTQMARQTRHDLIPAIVRLVALSWYDGLAKSEQL